VSLDPEQREIARIVLRLPEAGMMALAGGGAMLEHALVQRPTQDIDLFTPVASDVGRVAPALIAALVEAGYHPEAPEMRGDSFVRVPVTTPAGREIMVELAVDARIRHTVELSLGPVLHPEEIAADKVLALFGRAAARDLVDVDALTRRFDEGRLLELALEKDPGFDQRRFAEALNVACTRRQEGFDTLGVSPAETEAIKARARAWAIKLLAGA
jgi:Nucleotidyl transferase AbiEii toxin, Type IV TA system